MPETNVAMETLNTQETNPSKAGRVAAIVFVGCAAYGAAKLTIACADTVKKLINARKEKGCEEDGPQLFNLKEEKQEEE